jgi:hypothetical protein
MTAQISDPWETAENAKEPVFSNIVWGQVEAHSWWCVLERGVGRFEFDPQKHNADQRRTQIDIIVYPLSEMNLAFDLTRGMLAESHEWVSFVLPSIREAGLSLKQLDGAWVKVQTVPLTDKAGNVMTYTDSNTGNLREKTTLKFLAGFANEDECRADYLKESGKPAQAASQNANGNGGNGENGNKERETALKFLKVYIQNVCKGQTDLTIIRQKLAEQIAGQPLISKYFTVDSPEVVQMIAECMTL